MPEPSLFSPAQLALDIVIDNILHEVRRALRRPVPLLGRGVVADYQQTALAWGWLAERDDRFAAPTDAGLKALAEQQARHG